MASGGCVDNLVRKYWAVDYCGNASDTIEQIIMIVDETPPEFYPISPMTRPLSGQLDQLYRPLLN